MPADAAESAKQAARAFVAGVPSDYEWMYEAEQLVVPVNVNGSHWCLCVAHVQRKTIQYYDPLGGSGAHCCNGLKAFFKDEVRPRVVPPEVCPA